MSKVFIKTDTQNRIRAINSDDFVTDTSGWILIDEGRGDRYHHAQGNYLSLPLVTEEGAFQYKYVDGEATERTAEEIQADIDALPPPVVDALRVMFRILAKADTIPAEAALDNKSLFADWAAGVLVEAGEYRLYEDGLYRCVQGHTTQADWAPDVALSLWTRINREGEIPDWTAGGWAQGVKVRHNGKVWLSMVDNNTWEPGGAGVYDNIWKEVVA